ncbi:MAG: hypothetical protein ACRDJV_08510 [Actinomycetota bacterium]
MNERKRNAAVAAIVLIVVPIALLLLWRAWSGPGVLVSYTRSGGLAGITERMVVYRDGRVVYADNRDAEHEFTVSDRELSRVEETLADGNWPSEPTVYGRPTVADGFQHDLSYDGHIVRAYDEVRIEWLDRAIDAVGALRGDA